MIDKILPFLIAAGIGFAIGMERERRYANQPKAMGVRSFILMAVLGALAGYVSAPLIAAVISLFAAALVVSAYFQTERHRASKSSDIGLTTELAAGVTFVVGYLVHVDAFLATFLGLMTLVVLLSRERLHDFTVKKITAEEIQAAVIIFVFALGVLPLLPKQAIDAWGILNLQRFATLLILIGSVQFLGYVATRIFGAVVGFPISGFISGFVSSTAVFLTMPARVKENPRIANAAAAASLFAAVATFAFLLVVVGVISIPLAVQVAPPLLVSIVLGAVSAYFLARHDTDGQSFPHPKNPMSLVGALKLAALLSGFIILIGLLQHFIGDVGTQFASFLAGLVELHGVSVGSASLFAGGKLEFDIARNNILLAALASLISKLAITWVLIRERYALWITAFVGLMLAGFVITWLVM